MRTTTKRLVAGSVLAVAMGLGVTPLWAQGKEEGERGFVPTGSYQLSEIETVNTKNGNVLLQVPLASLPPGRGGEPGFQLTLNYNSQLRDLLVSQIWNVGRVLPGDPFFLEERQVGEAFGSPGWRYSYDYRVDVQDRNAHRSQFDNYCDGLPLTPGGGDDFISKHWYRFQVRMVFPDGSVHLFRPVGEDDPHEDNYFRIYPSGWRMRDSGHCKSPANALLGWDPPAADTNTVYYSIDGSYLRLEFEPDPAPDRSNPPTVHEITLWQDNRWTLTFPDGRQVKGVGLTGNEMRNPLRREIESLDPNNPNDNATIIRIHRTLDGNGNPVDEIRDALGRTIVVDPGYQQESATETIRMTGAGGQALTWTVQWGDTNVNRAYTVRTTARNEAGTAVPSTDAKIGDVVELLE